MKSSSKDKIEGGLNQASGKVKEVVGKATDNPKLTAKGQAENLTGKIQSKIGDIKKVVGK